MKTITLTHKYTPPKLDIINQDLSAAISAELLDEKVLLMISILRDECITAHLASLEQEQKKQFCKEELKVNETLVELARRLFDVSGKELTSLIRGRKAVKKYI